MIDLVRLNAIKKLDKVRRIGDVAVVEEQSHAVDVRVVVEVIDPFGIERRGAPDYAVDLVSFAQQKLGKVRTILPGDPGNKRLFHGLLVSWRDRQSHFLGLISALPLACHSFGNDGVRPVVFLDIGQ
jgi:hypothetical protein